MKLVVKIETKNGTVLNKIEVEDMYAVTMLSLSNRVASHILAMKDVSLKRNCSTSNVENKNSSTLELTVEEAITLKEKLSALLAEAVGVDVWLAPGGVLDVNEVDTESECFLDCDEEAHLHLSNILEKLK